MTNDEDSEGQIVLVTDASPRGGSIDGVISRAQSLGIKVNVMLSGDCVAALATAETNLTVAEVAAAASAREAFERIARETGGLYFYLPGGSAQDYVGILIEIFENAVAGDDTTPPTLTVSATPTVLWPPNRKMIRVETNVSVTDDQDPAPIVSLVGVTSNEPSDGQGDGNTEDDIVINDDGSIHLRAERSGSGHGRFYTITYQATDDSGNVGFGAVDVVVPHDR